MVMQINYCCCCCCIKIKRHTSYLNFNLNFNRIYYTGGFFTRTDLALEKANFKLFNRDRGDKPNVLVVITDGGSTHGPGNDIAKPIPDVVKPLVVSWAITSAFCFATDQG